MEKRELAIVSGIVGVLLTLVAVLAVILALKFWPQAPPEPPPVAEPPSAAGQAGPPVNAVGVAGVPLPPTTAGQPPAGQPPVPTSPTSPSSPTAGGEEAAVTAVIYQWAQAWENNVTAMAPYQGFYDPDFWSNYKSRSGMNYQKWIADKAAKARKATCIKVNLTSLSVKIEGDFATATFLQEYQSNTYCDTGMKTLYLLKRAGAWKIVGEEQPTTAKCSAHCSTAKPSEAPALGQASPEISAMLEQWARAWENNVSSLDQYQSFYDLDFWSNYKSRSGMNYQQWMNDKAAKAEKAACIKVQVSKLSVQMEKDVAIARFSQRYLSNNYCDSGSKTMYLAKRGGAWKIIGEEQGPTKKCSERCKAQ